MATHRLDFIGGNDANSGADFANRWKTINTGATAARTAPGDDVLCMGQFPVSLGVNITLTNKSATGTLASAVTQNVSLCQAAMTPSANVTAATSTTRKQGTVSTQLTFAAGFTTGLAAYETITSLDVSTKQKLSLWVFIAPGVNVASGALQIALCSDTAGATPVDTFTINRALVQNNWYCITLDRGTTMGAAIQSWAVYALTDPGAAVVRFDNVLACNDLTLSCLIGPDSSATSLNRWTIRSINDTDVQLDQGQNTDIGTTAKGYYGTTVTTTAYVVEPAIVSAGQVTNEAGTSDSALITFKGGYNISDMTSQDGYTWIAMDQGSSGTMVSVSHNYVKFDRFVAVRNSIGFSVGTSSVRFNDCKAVGMQSTGLNLGSSASTRISGMFEIQQGAGTGFSTSSPASLYIPGTVKAVSINGVGIAFNGRGVINNLIAYNCSSNGISISGGVHTINTIIASDSVSGFAISSGFVSVKSIVANSNTQYGLSASNALCEIWDVSTTGNTLAGVLCQSGAYLKIGQTNCAEASKVITDAIAFGGQSRVDISRYEGDVNDSRVYMENTLVAKTQTSERHTAADVAWQIDPTANMTVDNPFILYCEPTVFGSGTQGTHSIYMKRSNTNIVAKLVVPAYQLDGVSEVSGAAASSGSWEQVSANFTPSEAGPVAFEIHCYRDSGSGTLYLDDSDATQV